MATPYRKLHKNYGIQQFDIQLTQKVKEQRWEYFYQNYL
ncbi:MAG: hypothetical protein JETT_2187 [Candidatus Jettenia ecosi]|uniref:Uncharacterized protein n=1 Tax=Candidatus Jettenia ecosi TaxID=2494326 RepID=A0A533QA09_9BACT|nr:MAG: hypothetical protein JETT_2187 [Candidatus Jettenia ecosi]